ncbi:MAG: crotonase/enoyl-CoA hydratase family protein [Deltaproteobacteria bacterium]|nr:MAG: crotonase/enoyl-CoA hydratase family protein [Deltaproteobacteria bacterium]
MSELVKITIADHIADVRFNRPEKYNALSFDMIDAMADAINLLSKEPGVRVVVISGEGKSFCAGLDIENFAAMQAGENKFPNLTDRYQNRITNIYQHIGYGWKELPVPVIAAIHGVALGGGLQIALGADIRFCTPDTKFSIMEMRWGLIPDMSVTQTIRDVVSIDVAKELIFTGKTIKGEEAARLNLVTHVCEKPYEEAMALAREIASKNPDAVRAAKKLINEVWHGDSGRGLMMESELMMTLMGSPNQLEAVTANFTKQPPKFKDPA